MLSILKASAGSGKTFALTKQYLIMILGEKVDGNRYRLNTHASDRHRHILAITFTNKATDEMKQRIIHELAVLAGLEPLAGKKSPYLKELTSLFGCSEDQLSRQAAKALRQLLFDFGSFHVSTIDAFFQSILRAFAYEAELEGDYELELDSRTAFTRAVDDLLSSINTQPDTPESKATIRWITQYLLDQIRESGSVSIFNRNSTDFSNIVSLITSLSDETFMEHYDEMMGCLTVDAIEDFKNAVNNAMTTIAARCTAAAAEALRAIDANPLPGKGKYDSNMLKAMASIANTGSVKKTNATVPKLASGEGKICSVSALPHLNENVKAAIISAARQYVDSQTDLQLLSGIRSQIFVLGLFHGVYKRIRAERTEKNVLLLADTNDLLHRIIGKDDAPFVFERVGIMLRHFLIDEFQDTSSLQWQNLRPLLENSHAEGHDNLIIGDEKQCIYRFRSSDPTLLQSRVRSDIGEPVWPEIDPDTGHEDCGMGTNWRSSADIVAFNNDIFGEISRLCRAQHIYTNVCQAVAPSNTDHRGYIDVAQIDAPTKDEFQAKALERMIVHIKRQLNSGYRPCDIVVLIRKNRQARMVVDYLLETIAADGELAARNVRVVSDDAMAISSSPAVRRIMAVLRAIATSSNIIDTKASERKDSNHRSRRELINLINRYELSLGEGHTPAQSLAEAISQCDVDVEPPIDMSKISCVSLPSLVERIVAHYFPGGTVPPHEMTHLLAFEDLVTDFCATSSPDIQSFIRWWDTTGSTATISAAADEGAIRVMTIHKAKGLEFPCVHLPLLSDLLVDFSRDNKWFVRRQLPGVPLEVTPPLVPMRPDKSMLDTIYREDFEKLYAEQLIDEINVLYVAFTRAVDELTVTFKAAADERRPITADDILYSRATAGTLLAGALACMGFAGPVDTWGNPTQHEVKKERRTRAIDPSESIDMPPYTVDERDSLWASTRVETSIDTMMGRERGIVLHDILAGISTRTDIFKAVGRAVRCGRLPRHSREATVKWLNDAIDSSPLISGWFSDTAHPMRERSIVMTDGTVLRPDRVVWHDDGSVEIIDYKFGNETNKRYHRQVISYINALRNLGHKRVSGYLWYVTLGRIERVDPA